jgi:hypothetical protein
LQAPHAPRSPSQAGKERREDIIGTKLRRETYVQASSGQTRVAIIAAVILAGIVIAVTLALAIGNAVGHWPAAIAGMPACPTEDSTNCVWDASSRGDGNGRSFVDIDGVAYYSEAGR